jgi:diguanylate cyclase (GGDEF)-like protein
METNNEYNEYLGASYISVLSTASVKASINVKLYTAIAFVFLVVVCCGCVAVLGRVGDIVDYVFFTDHLTGFHNRSWLDRFFRSMEKKILDDGVVYCAVDFVGISKINDQLSRSTGDAVLKYFSAELKESFGKSPAEFVYNGNGTFVVLLEKSDYITAEDILRLFRLKLDEREEFADVPFSFKIGIAETFRNQQSARKLLAEAIRKRQEFSSPEEKAEDAAENKN